MVSLSSERARPLYGFGQPDERKSGLRRDWGVGTALVMESASRRRPCCVATFFPLTAVLSSYFRVALRTLRRHRAHTLLTVSGLALGMAVCLLVGAFAWHLGSYDGWHDQSDRIVRVITDRIESDGETTALGATPAPLGAEIQADVPGVESVVRIGELSTSAIRDGRAVELTGLFADSTFFDMFDFETAQGDGRAALSTPGTLLLTPQAASRIFGSVDPIGQTVTLEGQTGDAFVVTGLLAEPKGPSHLQFDALASFTNVDKDDAVDWRNTWNFATYLLLDHSRRPSASTMRCLRLPRASREAWSGSCFAFSR